MFGVTKLISLTQSRIMKESEKPRTRYKVGKRLFDTRAEARYYKKTVCLEQKKDDCTLDE